MINNDMLVKRWIQVGVEKFWNSGPSENLNFIIKAITKITIVQSRMGNSFTGAPTLIIKMGLDLGLLKSLPGPGDPRKTVDDTQMNNHDDDDDDHEQLINL